MEIEALDAIITALGFVVIGLPLIALTVGIVIYILVIRAIIKYAAKKIAEENIKQQQKIFGEQANYIAARIATEIQKTKSQNENEST